MMKTGTFIFFLLLRCCFAMESGSQDCWSEIRDIVDDPSNQFNGILLLKEKDEVLLSLDHGIADKTTLTPLSLENKFICGSITKQMIATLILKEVERGKIDPHAPKIDLHTPLINYRIAQDYTWAKEVTCHHLLSHTSGVLHPNKKPSFQPGEGFAYSNYGYHLLGQLLEKTKGQSLQDIFEDLFADINLQESCYYAGDQSSPVTHIDNLVPGYMRFYGTNYWLPKQDPYKAIWPFPYLYPASAGVVTTASDLHRWNSALHNGEIISDESLKLMQGAYSTNKAHYFPEKVEYGYGLQVVDDQGLKEFSHAGYVWGYMAMNCYYPKQQTSLIMMQNVAEPLLSDSMSWRKYAFRSFIAIRNKVRHMIIEDTDTLAE